MCDRRRDKDLDAFRGGGGCRHNDARWRRRWLAAAVAGVFTDDVLRLLRLRDGVPELPCDARGQQRSAPCDHDDDSERDTGGGGGGDGVGDNDVRGVSVELRGIVEHFLRASFYSMPLALAAARSTCSSGAKGGQEAAAAATGTRDEASVHAMQALCLCSELRRGHFFRDLGSTLAAAHSALASPELVQLDLACDQRSFRRLCDHTLPASCGCEVSGAMGVLLQWLVEAHVAELVHDALAVVPQLRHDKDSGAVRVVESVRKQDLQLARRLRRERA